MSFERKPGEFAASQRPQHNLSSAANNLLKGYATVPGAQLPQYDAHSPPPTTLPMELPHSERSYASSPSPGQHVQPYGGAQYHDQPQMQQLYHRPGPQGGYPPQLAQYQQPGYFPQMQQGQTGGNTMAIASLQSSPAPILCPSCGQHTTTATTQVVGNTTHAWGVGTCILCFGACFIPYLMSSLKDVEHRCPRCGIHLATWHKSGRTDVKMPG